MSVMNGFDCFHGLGLAAGGAKSAGESLPADCANGGWLGYPEMLATTGVCEASHLSKSAFEWTLYCPFIR